MNRFRISHPGGYCRTCCFLLGALRQTENAVRDALEERGYSEIITPAVEYFDVFAQANPELDQDQMLKIIDKSGRICVARPDNTTPIARIAATRLDDAALPVRLYYSQKVFRSVSGDHGHKGEFLVRSARSSSARTVSRRTRISSPQRSRRSAAPAWTTSASSWVTPRSTRRSSRSWVRTRLRLRAFAASSKTSRLRLWATRSSRLRASPLQRRSAPCRNLFGGIEVPTVKPSPATCAYWARSPICAVCIRR